MTRPYATGDDVSQKHSPHFALAFHEFDGHEATKWNDEPPVSIADEKRSFVTAQKSYDCSGGRKGECPGDGELEVITRKPVGPEHCTTGKNISRNCEKPYADDKPLQADCCL